MAYYCEICGRTFSRKQNLAMHMNTHKKEKLMIDPVGEPPLTSKVKMLESAVEELSTGTPPVGYRSVYGYNRMPIEERKEDSFDKMLRQFMQIMMIKQLASSTNSSMFGDMMKFQAFLDGREMGEDQDENSDILSVLIKAIAGDNPIGAIMDKKKVNPMTQTLITDTPIKSVQEVNRTLPLESDLLKYTDKEIVEFIQSEPKYQQYEEAIKNGTIKKDFLFQQLLAMYPNFPKERFDNIYEELIK